MKRKSLIALIFAALTLLALLGPVIGVKAAIAGDKSGVYMQEPSLVEPCVFNVPVILPPSLEPQREKLEASVLDAQRIVREFARKNQWENLLKDSIFDSVEIYDRKEEFDRRIIDLSGDDASVKIPATYCAALERRVLITVSPELFLRSNPKFPEEQFFEKVMAHEITHRLHVRILADENAMGPIWFFEGFAIYGAGHMNNDMPVLSHEEIWRIVEDEKRGDYRKYNVVFRHFVGIIPLKKLVKMAAQRNFIEILRKVEKEQDHH